MCACVHAHVRVCVCAEHDTCVSGVCLWKKPGWARGGENVRVRYIHLFLLRFIILNVPFSSLEPICQRNFFFFMLCILMNNKDLIDVLVVFEFCSVPRFILIIVFCCCFLLCMLVGF